MLLLISNQQGDCRWNNFRLLDKNLTFFQGNTKVGSKMFQNEKILPYLFFLDCYAKFHPRTCSESTSCIKTNCFEELKKYFNIENNNIMQLFNCNQNSSVKPNYFKVFKVILFWYSLLSVIYSCYLLSVLTSSSKRQLLDIICFSGFGFFEFIHVLYFWVFNWFIYLKRFL